MDIEEAFSSDETSTRHTYIVKYNIAVKYIFSFCFYFIAIFFELKFGRTKKVYVVTVNSIYGT